MIFFASFRKKATWIIAAPFCIALFLCCFLLCNAMSDDVLDFSTAYPDILLLVASETGNARELAEEMAETLEDVGFEVHLRDLSTIATEALGHVSQVIVCASTTGNGDLPNSSRAFHEALTAQPPDLSHLAFGVVALGDRTYTHFANGGHLLRQALLRAGAIETTNIHEIDRGPSLEQVDEALGWALQCAASFAVAFRDT